MDESLRALQRQYELGEINVIQWMNALQRAGFPYQHLLIETWERLLSTPQDSFFLVPNYAGTSIEYAPYLYAALELLKAYPLQCSCQQCLWVTHNGFCTCCLTGICSPPRSGFSNPEQVVMTTNACPSCQNGCTLVLPDKYWVHPGKLSLEVEIISERIRHRPDDLWGNRTSVLTRCRYLHYERISEGDDFKTPTNECRGTIRQQLLFMMRHAFCRIDVRPEERDEDLETWRDILSELGPGELPPY